MSIAGKRERLTRTPGSTASILLVLLTTNTPRTIPFGFFLIPMAAMRVALGSHNSVYGSFCLVLKVVLEFGESDDNPKIE